jgi:hypothetical protein
MYPQALRDPRSGLPRPQAKEYQDKHLFGGHSGGLVSQTREKSFAGVKPRLASATHGLASSPRRFLSSSAAWRDPYAASSHKRAAGALQIVDELFVHQGAVSVRLGGGVVRPL